MVGIVKSVDYYSPYLVEWDSHLIYGFNIINLTDQIPPDFFWNGASINHVDNFLCILDPALPLCGHFY